LPATADFILTASPEQETGSCMDSESIHSVTHTASQFKVVGAARANCEV